MSSLEKCLRKGGQLQALFQRRKFKERTFRTDDVDGILSQGVTFQELCDLLGQKIQPVIWMGDDTFIRSRQQSQRRALDSLDHTAPQGFKRFLVLRLALTNDIDNFDIAVYSRESTTNSYTSCLNLLFHLIALEGTIRRVAVNRPSGTSRSERPVLPVPPSALKRFISNTQSSRRLGFVLFSISEEQGRVLFSHSNPNVVLGLIDIGLLHDRGQFLFDALASNQSPISLSIGGTEDLSDELFRAFVLGLRGNTTLKHLELTGWHSSNRLSPQRMRLLLEALTGNLGLESLDLSHQQLSLAHYDSNWDALWDALSHHPSIICVKVRGGSTLTQEQQIRRTQSIVCALETNTHMSNIAIDSNIIVDDELMKKSVLPTLEINPFRPHIQAIVQEPERSLRWKILGRSLQHRRVQNNLTIRYLLLSKNADLLQSDVLAEAATTAIHMADADEDVSSETDCCSSACSLLPPPSSSFVAPMVVVVPPRASTPSRQGRKRQRRS